MVKIKKILYMIIVVIFSVTGLFYNKVEATTYEIRTAELYSKGQVTYFKYKGEEVVTEFVVYQNKGIEYPAYCLNKTLNDVETGDREKVRVNQGISNMAVWRAVKNGYPYKTLEELGCESKEEAFVATKLAVYDALNTYNWTEVKAINEAGERVIRAAKNISKIAKGSSEVKLPGKVEIQKVTDKWEADDIVEGYISKTYKVITNAESSKYRVEINGLYLADGAKVTDKLGNQKVEFSSEEEFKVLIPVSEIETKLDIQREFHIIVEANLKTMPILYGETASDLIQNYALATEQWEYDTVDMVDKYSSNKTKLQIIKEDTETKQGLKNAKFNILNKNKEVVYADVTSKDGGLAQVKGIAPGTYYIKEIQSPYGYTKYEDEIEIKIKYNETYTVKVNNYKKPKTEDKKVEEKSEISVTGKQEEKLPVTGF